MAIDKDLAENCGTQARPQQIASWLHLAGFLLIGAGVVAFGVLAQHNSGGTTPAEAGQLARHSQAIPIYLGAIIMDWALLYYCWVGVHRSGGNLKQLSGEIAWSWESLLADVGIVVPFWLMWEGTAWAVHWILTSGGGLLGSGAAKTVDNLLPHSLTEVLLWVATSVTAGICEELAFRGYVQRQFHALTGSAAIAILLQGLIFGLFHSYQGTKNVVVICVLGLLYGALAEWRKNLRANIIAHGWYDIWEGWLKFLLWS